MKLSVALFDARLELQCRPFPDRTFLDYVKENGIDQAAMGRFVGGYGVIDIVDHGAGRFDFPGDDGAGAFPAFVLEALGDDGETVIDLVAWQLDGPSHVLSMFGRCGLLGVWEAMAPGTYFMGAALTMHRTPLDWLKSGCSGAAIVTPGAASWQMVEVPGRIAARDHAHGRELVSLLRTAIDPATKIVVPSKPWRLAA